LKFLQDRIMAAFHRLSLLYFIGHVFFLGILVQSFVMTSHRTRCILLYPAQENVVHQMLLNFSVTRLRKSQITLLLSQQHNEYTPNQTLAGSHLNSGIISSNKNYRKRRKYKQYNRKTQSSSPIEVQKRLLIAQEVDSKLMNATKTLQSLVSGSKPWSTSNMYDSLSSSNTLPESFRRQETIRSKQYLSFPSVRECNAALATMGDTGDFKRALRLFGLMRKSVTLVNTYQSLNDNHELGSNDTSSRLIIVPPSPTLVTYSTLMSRAVALGKARVALRLWRLMILQRQFFCNIRATTTTTKSHDSNSYIGAPIVPDIKAVNILMNAFAKMEDPVAARTLMDQLYNGKVVPYEQSSNTHHRTGGDFTSGFVDLIRVIPRMQPNIVTYNTLIDAYHRAGDLDAALDVLRFMKKHTSLQPDARTYTSLISTVGRRLTKSSGAKDPDLAFSLLDEMVNEAGVRPNGMTYSALIDVCGRCRRSDLALKGLRMMIRQKVNRARENMESKKSDLKEKDVHQVILHNEVGAWTAAIDACGKVGRLETAIRLFHTMEKFGAKPNTVTCGCLTDSLLKSGKIDETLKVLKYMKKEGIEPSEVMYTSLITSASVLAKTENAERGELILNEFGSRVRDPTSSTMTESDNEDRMKALDVYTALIQSLTGTKTKSKSTNEKFIVSQENLVVKVFLILQEMKASGADPDIACYNAILRACAGSGDIGRLRDVLRRIEMDKLVPNSTTWKEILRGTSFAADGTTAEEMWNRAMVYKVDNDDSYSTTWTPRIDDFELLLSAYSKEAERAKSQEMKAQNYIKMIHAYNKVANGNGDEIHDVEESSSLQGLHHIDLSSVHSSRNIVKMIQKAANFLDEYSSTKDDETQKDILTLPSNTRAIAMIMSNLSL
jgi:pentatricopeptide repeat protein